LAIGNLVGPYMFIHDVVVHGHIAHVQKKRKEKICAIAKFA